jgi:hypothetical protein
MIVYAILYRVKMLFSARPQEVRLLLCASGLNFDGHNILLLFHLTRDTAR